MRTKFELLLDKYQSNTYPAMQADLAEHLGISADSIRRLGLGWAPVVTFNDRKTRKPRQSYIGWWCVPERTQDAEVIGLSLRSQDDHKVMYPGGRHGLVYEVNPNHSAGERGYSAGPQNWVRTMDAGIACPICHKPDGCLLSADNPTDPKAVVCIRVAAESTKPLRFGNLHILKTEGLLRNVSPLADGNAELPVVVVEGFSDTAAAMDLGFVAVGRPSNLACMDMLRDLVRNRPCVVIGENDKKPDGREPGREGMIAALQTIKQVSRDVKMIMPPAHVKDLRAWKNKYGLTRDELLKYIDKHGQTEADKDVLTDDRPLTIARAFLGEKYRLSSRYILRRWEETWYRFGGTRYVALKGEDLIQPLYQWAHSKMISTETKKGDINLVPMRMNTTLKSQVEEAVIAETAVLERRVPVWVNGQTGPDPKDLIVFTNGVLNVSAFLAGDPDALLDSTPDLFTTAALSVAFDPVANCPTWDKFLDSSLGDDPAKIALLQEWIGYNLTADTSMQKMLFMRGPTASGKGRILEVLSALVGEDQSCDTSFADLSGQFGLAPLVGKLICTIGDARAPKNGAATRGLELLLNIVGNDGVQVNRKFKDQLERHRLIARISIASNEILDVPDHAGALIRRLNLLEFKKSFAANPDYSLPKKLTAESELQGIAVWALEGLKRLREQGAFTIPKSSREALLEWRVETSPVAWYIEECCDPDPEAEIGKREMFDAWVAWSGERRIEQMSQSKFFSRLKSNAPYVETEVYEQGVHKMNVFKGIKLKAWAARQFLRRPDDRR